MVYVEQVKLKVKAYPDSKNMGEDRRVTTGIVSSSLALRSLSETSKLAL